MIRHLAPWRLLRRSPTNWAMYCCWATAGYHPSERITNQSRLLTIYFGLGIFGANAVFDYTRETRGRYQCASTSRLNYLTAAMYGYRPARYAWLREETDPDWGGHPDTNPRTFLNRGLRHRRHSA
jgi:hypothetical protein